MTAAVLWGLLAGSATFGLSELLLKVWGDRPMKNIWKLSLAGIALRAVWILGVLAAVLSQDLLEAAPFTIALLASYLVAQVWEGFRYQRFIETR